MVYFPGVCVCVSCGRDGVYVKCVCVVCYGGCGVCICCIGDGVCMSVYYVV